jgi:hypothetical protein
MLGAVIDSIPPKWIRDLITISVYRKKWIFVKRHLSFPRKRESRLCLYSGNQISTDFKSRGNSQNYLAIFTDGVAPRF